MRMTGPEPSAETARPEAADHVCDTVEHPLGDIGRLGTQLSGVLEYWNSLPKVGGAAFWDAFDPLRIAPVLPRIMLYRLEPADAGFFIRIMGEEAVEVLQFNGNGRRLEEVMPEPNLTDASSWLREVCRCRQPRFVAKSLIWQDRGYVEYRVLMMPFCDTEGTVSHLLSAFHFHYTV